VDISVIMVDGQFRENPFSAEYFCKQQFSGTHEVIWVEFYSRVPERVRRQEGVEIVTLGHPPDSVYHSSYCFNEGIRRARGDLLVIPDADQIVKPDFLERVRGVHRAYDRMAVYAYRYDEVSPGAHRSHEFGELEEKCVLNNPINYGGCLTVRREWLLQINGYEQHRFFSTGFHANGRDVYTRFKNLGLAVMWAPELKLYHPWHENSLVADAAYRIQRDLIAWRSAGLHHLAIDGIDRERNDRSFDEAAFLRGRREDRPPRLWG